MRRTKPNTGHQPLTKHKRQRFPSFIGVRSNRRHFLHTEIQSDRKINKKLSSSLKLKKHYNWPEHAIHYKRPIFTGKKDIKGQSTYQKHFPSTKMLQHRGILMSKPHSACTWCKISIRASKGSKPWCVARHAIHNQIGK